MIRAQADPDAVALALVRGDAPPPDAPPPAEAEYLRAIRESIRYLAAYTSGGPDLSAMAPAARDRYVMGYALPFVRAGISTEAIRESAVRYTERKDAFFPKNPGILLEIARTIMADRAPGWKPPLALDAPPMERDDWVARSNATRARMCLPPLPEEAAAREAA